MNNVPIAEELDRGITEVLAGEPEPDPSTVSVSSVAGLLDLARELQSLPRSEFRGQLRVELQWEAAGRSMSPDRTKAACAASVAEIFPTLCGKSFELYPLRSTNLAASVAAHACVLLLVGLGVFAARRAPTILAIKDRVTTVHLSVYPAVKGSGDGSNGGGGAHMKTNASKGALPASSKVQFATPVVQLPDRETKLPVQASIIAPPDLNLPHAGPTGDPLSKLLIPSGGPGVRSGIGPGDRGGVGGGHGPGFGDGAFGPGNGVSWPRAIYFPEPEFSDEARREHYQGIVSLLIVVGPDGRARDIHILRALGMGLDEKAIAAVRTWRFEPGMKDGRPVPVLMEVDVDFRIH